MRNLEQIRAAAALVVAPNTSKAAVSKLPAMILANGLLSTAAFGTEKKKDGSTPKRPEMEAALRGAAKHLATPELGISVLACESRSLYLDRFSDPGAKDSGDKHPRRDWFNSLRGKRALSVASDSRSEWLTQTTATGKGDLLFAQLQSRLMVNMAGGVMENAGLCLDRFGLPYIPGSAVKGCARRAGLAALHEWCDTGSKPVEADNLFTPACASFQSPAEMLASIAHVFGWSEQDWKNRSDFRSDDEWKKKRSDFAWACGDAGWGPARQTAQVLLGGSASGPSPDSSTQAADNLFASARQQRPLSKHFAGNVSFVSAHPVNLSKVDGLLMVVPPLGQLELDVVTCHHGEYYASKDPNKKATDTEEPVPVVFPAIAPGHVFAFALLPPRDCATELLKHARTWLATGLSTLGLGAKTATGYGWFDTSQSTHQEIVKSLEKLKLDRKLAEAKAKKDAADKAEQEEIARRTRILGSQAVQAHRSRGSIIKLANLNR